MGLYKLCDHKGRARDRCEHAWWARFRHVRVSLEKWANREIKTKTEAAVSKQMALYQFGGRSLEWVQTSPVVAYRLRCWS